MSNYQYTPVRANFFRLLLLMQIILLAACSNSDSTIGLNIDNAEENLTCVADGGLRVFTAQTPSGAVYRAFFNSLCDGVIEIDANNGDNRLVFFNSVIFSNGNGLVDLSITLQSYVDPDNNRDLVFEFFGDLAR